MYVHTLRFHNLASLHRAFDTLKSSVYLTDCLAEPERLELRFRAVPPHADRLIERIYGHGGLAWCERHRLRSFQGLRVVGRENVRR
jgi:hypothetical protein